MFSVVDRFRFVQVREVWILETPDLRDWKSFPLATVFHYTQVSFKTGFTVIKHLYIKDVIFLFDF